MTLETNLIKVNLTKAKDEKVHPVRRTKRSEMFKLVDGDSMFTSLNAEGEALRTQIKSVDDQLQIDIDNCQDIESLKTCLESIETAYDQE